jgi:Alginate export
VARAPGFRNRQAWNTALLVEGDLVWRLRTDYNSTMNGNTAYLVVADPETYEINRLQLTNTSLPMTTLTAGRQRIVLDDHRFVGNVSWRQNEQTFDSLRFTTPLATLHRFQGWADKFLTTPADGIDDRYVNAGVTFKGVGPLETLSALASYHVYEAERTSREYGAELDAQIEAKWRRFTGIVKYAGYEAEDLFTDTEKLWVQLEYVW